MNFKAELKRLPERRSAAGVEVALAGGLGLRTMGIFPLTKDVDFLIPEESAAIVDRIMTELG
jgi:hypothetical protein